LKNSSPDGDGTRSGPIALIVSESDVISEHEFSRVRLEKYLPVQVVDVVTASVVSKERDGDDERHQSLAIIVNELLELSTRGRVEALLQVARGVLQHVGVAPARGNRPERLHEAALIILTKDCSLLLFDRRYQTPEFTIVVGRVSAQLKLVRGMKGDDVSRRPSSAKEFAKSLVCEYTFDEILAQLRIVQPAFVLYGEVRVRLHQG
jgi:hypothetical protein